MKLANAEQTRQKMKEVSKPEETESTGSRKPEVTRGIESADFRRSWRKMQERSSRDAGSTES